MPRPTGQSLTQLANEAARYAASYFDPVEQARVLSERERPVDGDYAVLVINHFVPIDWVPGSESMLRKFTRHGGNGLEAAECKTLDEYRRELGAGGNRLREAFEAGEPTPTVATMARGHVTWPAVGVAGSEDEMRELLMQQFETLRKSDVLWQCVDSSSYPCPKPDGIYVLIDWSWHGW